MSDGQGRAMAVARDTYTAHGAAESTTTTPSARATPTSPFMDEKMLCAHLNISPVTATKWRAKAYGPPFIKIGRLVRYRSADVETWLETRTRRTATS